MKTLTIYGASDDLVEVTGSLMSEEYYADSDGSWVGVVSTGDESALVYVDFRRNGTWTVSLGQVDEERELPEWPVTFQLSETGYSVEMTLELPDDATFEEFKSV